MNRIILIGLLALMLVSRAGAQRIVKKIDKSVKQSKIETHMMFLASDEMRGRNTATVENAIAARYIAEHFRAYGVKTAPGHDTYFQSVPLIQNRAPDKATFTVGDSAFALWDDLIFLSSVPGKLKAEMVYVDFGFEEDLKGKDVKGKILIAKAGNGNPDDGIYRNSMNKIKSARAAGALALIELYRPAMYPWKLLVNYLSGDRYILDEGASEEPFPSAWMLDASGELLSFFREMDGQEATIEISGSGQSAVTVPNVVGYIEGTDPELKNEYVIVSAHLDHVGVKNVAEDDSIWNGARDNGIGIVNMLTVAEFFGKNPPARSVAFLACNAEEVGLLGSRWYADHPWIPLEKTVFNMNTDTGGYNDVSKVTVVGFNRTSVTEKLARSAEAFGLEAIDDPLPEENYYDRSDNVSFAAKGVPAISYGPGYTEMNEEITKYYHQPADEPHTLDYDYLTKYSKAFIYALHMVADSKEAIFWTPGDKYEAAGKELYGRK